MGSPGVGGTISAASDVALNNPVQDDLLLRDTGYWRNIALTGKVALANKGGVENVSTTNATGATTLNLNNGNVFSVALTGNATFSVSNATAGKACSFTLYLKQDATGGRTVTWPAGTKWSGGAPTLSAAAGAVDIFVLETIDNGTNWYASVAGLNFV